MLKRIKPIETLETIVKRLNNAGANVLLLKGKKHPVDNEWKHLKIKRQSQKELENSSRKNYDSAAIICNPEIGGFHVIDVDTKNDTPDLHIRFEKKLEENYPGLHQKLHKHFTPSGGKHIFFRCLKKTTDFIEAYNSQGKKILELFGSGSEPKPCHIAPSKGYVKQSGTPSIVDTPYLTDEEFQAIVDTILSFNCKKSKLSRRKRIDDSIAGKSTVGSRNENATLAIGTLISRGKSLSEIENLIDTVIGPANNFDKEEIIELKNTAKRFYEKPREKPAFWYAENGKAKISITGVIDFLTCSGIGQVFSDNQVPTIVRNENNIISPYCLEYITHLLLAHIEEQPDEIRFSPEGSVLKCAVKEEFLQKVGTILNKEKQRALPILDAKFHRDTVDTAFLYYKDFYLEITKDLITVQEYKNLSGCLWESQKIKRNYNPANSDTVGDFEDFISKVCDDKEDKILALRTAMGYLMHTYKKPSQAKAIILYDQSSIAEEGRTGKSIIGKALSHIRATERKDCRIWQNNSQFAFQDYSFGTVIYVLDDAKKNFPFEYMFHIITDTLTVEYKGEKLIKIPFEEAPKFLITSNYTFKGYTGSHEDRKREYEFSNYFSRYRKPIDLYGKEFFTGWDCKEWALFDSFMIECIQLYLRHGLTDCLQETLLRKKLVDAAGSHFADFVTQLSPIPLNTWLSKSELHEKYKAANITNKIIENETIASFVKHLKTYADIHNLRMLEKDAWINSKTQKAFLLCQR